jgi:hypothetical protein
LLLLLAVVGDGVPFLLLAFIVDGVPSSSSWSSLGGELELLGVAVLSHQLHHPSSFPSLSESDGKRRLLKVRDERLLSRRDEGRWPVGDANART